MKKIFNRSARALAAFVSALTLTSVFSGCSATLTRPQTVAQAATAVAPAPEIQTAYSRELDRMEAEAATLPGSAPVVMIDSDEFYIDQAGSPLTRYQSIPEQMSRRGVVPSKKMTADIMTQLGGFHMSEADATSFYLTKKEGHLSEKSQMDEACIVAPTTPDQTESEYNARFLGAQVNGTPEAWLRFSRTAYHELWHCLDVKFNPEMRRILAEDPSNNFEASYARHKSEMFADAAAALQMVKRGHPEVVRFHADYRAWRAVSTGPKHTHESNPSTDFRYYSGASYFTSIAHDNVLRHVDEAGIDAVRKYSMADIRRVAEEITERSCLTRAEFTQLTDYYLTSAGDAPVVRSATERYREAVRRLDPQPVAFTPESWWPHEFLEKTDPALVEEVQAEISSRAARYGGGAYGYRRAMAALIEEWRPAVDRGPAEESLRTRKKITLLGVLAELGYVNDLIIADEQKGQGRVKVAAVPAP